jgi:hypothetical protein
MKHFFTALLLIAVTTISAQASTITPAFGKWSSAGGSVDAAKQNINTMQVVGATLSKPGGKPTMTIAASVIVTAFATPQAAMNACAISGKTLFWPKGTYVITSTLLYDYVNYSMVFESGATIDATAVSGYALKVQSLISADPSWNKLYNAPTNGITGMHLIGTQSAGHYGILFAENSSSLYNGGNTKLKNCSIEQFDRGIEWGNNAYLNSQIDCQVFRCNTCLYYPSGLTNSGEGVRFVNCAFFNSLQVANLSATTFVFDSCSFDYFTNYAVFCQVGAVARLNNAHIETNLNGDYWLKTVDSLSAIILESPLFAITGPRTLELGNSVNTDGGIKLLSPFAAFAGTGSFSPASWFIGNVIVREPVDYDLGAKNIIWSANDNLLSDGGFENVASPSAEWSVVQGAAYDAPALDASNHNSGSKSLKFTTSGAGRQSSITKTFSITPGAKPIVLLYMKNSFGAGDSFTIATGYGGVVGNSTISAPYNLQTYSSAGTNYGAFTAVYTHPYTPAPQGATTFTITLTENNVSGTSTTWVDDINIEILDSPGLPFNFLSPTFTSLVTPLIKPLTDVAGVKIQNAAGTVNEITVDTTNHKVGVGIAPAYTFQVAGTSAAPTQLGFTSAGTSLTPFQIYTGGLAADTKWYDWNVIADGSLCLRAVNDSYSSSSNAFCVSRTGYALNGTRGAYTAFAALGTVPSAGYEKYCTDCTTAATCVGGGTGHKAVSNGTNWTCQ